jgi:hypothetical protein
MIVKTPICLKDIQNKTKQNAYKKKQEFLDDLKLMCDNSSKYNGENNLYTDLARELYNAAEQQVQSKNDEIMNLEGLIGNTALQF